jgi:tRNA (guanine37-N1)-methyltransferase
MQCDPLYRCLQDVTGGEKVHTIMMSAQGRTFNQQVAKELMAKEHFVIVCGHYEGIDHRFIEACVDEEISLGDFVLTGGELAAMMVTDAVCRMVPGVLPEDVCFQEESHFDGLLEYPQYSRPEVWMDRRVPEVLLSGHHENIRKWRRLKSLEITRDRRPDMFEKLELTKEDKKLLGLIKK